MLTQQLSAVSFLMEDLTERQFFAFNSSLRGKYDWKNIPALEPQSEKLCLFN